MTKLEKRENQRTRREREFFSIMPNGMRIVGIKANALMYRLGYEVRG